MITFTHSCLTVVISDQTSQFLKICDPINNYRVSQKKKHRTFAFFGEKCSKIIYKRFQEFSMREIDFSHENTTHYRWFFEKFSPKNAKIRFFWLTVYAFKAFNLFEFTTFSSRYVCSLSTKIPILLLLVFLCFTYLSIVHEINSFFCKLATKRITCVPRRKKSVQDIWPSELDQIELCQGRSQKKFRGAEL
jgi:hypothetical protein